MCGIAGISRNTTTSIPNGRRFAIDLARAIEDRGKDSTGFGWGQKDDPNHVYYSKLAGRASKVADLQPLPGTGIHSLIAHTRHGTKGSPLNNDNNHPVVAEHIVAVHNGRVDNDDELIEFSGVTERIGIVDSWAIPAMLSRKEALGATTKDVLELVEGVAAIAWLSSWEPGVLNLARLSTRPLSIGFTKRGDLVFASTVSNLRKASAIAKVAIEDVMSIKEGTYLRIVEGGIEEWIEFTPRHPKISYAVDLPGVSAPRPVNVYPPSKAPAKGKGKGGKGKGKVTTTMSHAEYLAHLDRQQRVADAAYTDSLRTDAAFDSYLDTLPDNAWERDVDWDNIVPRRGHKGWKARSLGLDT